MKILIIGHSHIHALKLAFEAENYNWPKNLSVEFIQLRAEEYFSIFLYKDRDDHAQKTKELAQLISESDAILVNFYGTIYNVIGLTNDPQPFDFISSSKDEDRSELGVTYIPKTLMDLQMKNYSHNIKNHIETLVGITPKNVPIFYFENPAPVGSEAHIRKYPARYADKIEERGISPLKTRCKLWQIHEKTICQYCADAGITFLPTSRKVLDKSGMLKPKYCAHDPAHCNAAYGELVLKDALATLSKR